MGIATIEVQEIPVLVDTLVLKGDTILVFNGVVIGSLEKREVPAPVAEVPKTKAPPVKDGINPDTITHATVTDGLHRLGAATTMVLCDHLGIERHDYRARAKVGRILTTLKAAHVVKPVADDHRLKFHNYTLTNLNGNHTNVP